MNHLVFGIKYLFNNQFLKKNTPLICGLTVTNKCNLNCRHCKIAKRGPQNSSFEETVNAINSFYNEGGRTLYLQGGEPFIWNDGNYNLEDIVKYSQKTGFLTTIIYTNGTFPLTTSADTVFISMDGLENTHNFLRGNTFNRIMENINNSKHTSLYINYTINNYNKNEIQDFCAYFQGIRQIQGTFFYFHTPYYGYDDLYITSKERIEILIKLLNLKKKYKILNSQAGIKSAIRNDWKRPLDICRVYEKGKTFNCCRFSGDPELCRNCGYLSYAEINQTLKYKPTAILNALKYF